MGCSQNKILIKKTSKKSTDTHSVFFSLFPPAQAYQSLKQLHFKHLKNQTTLSHIFIYVYINNSF